MTPDICDVCWGSGDSAKPWTNLRERAKESHERRRRIAELEASLAARDKRIGELEATLAEAYQ